MFKDHIHNTVQYSFLHNIIYAQIWHFTMTVETLIESGGIKYYVAPFTDA